MWTPFGAIILLTTGLPRSWIPQSWSQRFLASGCMSPPGQLTGILRLTLGAPDAGEVGRGQEAAFNNLP